MQRLYRRSQEGRISMLRRAAMWLSCAASGITLNLRPTSSGITATRWSTTTPTDRYWSSGKGGGRSRREACRLKFLAFVFSFFSYYLRVTLGNEKTQFLLVVFLLAIEWCEGALVLLRYCWGRLGHLSGEWVRSRTRPNAIVRWFSGTSLQVFSFSVPARASPPALSFSSLGEVFDSFYFDFCLRLFWR